MKAERIDANFIVDQKTGRLELRVLELEKLSNSLVSRELKMIECKAEIEMFEKSNPKKP